MGGVPEVIADVHPDNLRIAVQAAKLMRLKVAGVDFISEDARIPWYENGAAINEVNYSPSVSLRHDFQRHALQNIVDMLLPKQGRIPIEVYVGGVLALQKATERQGQCIRSGIRCYITTHASSYSNEGEMRLAFKFNSLFQRCRALLMNTEVEHLILVIQTDELVMMGLPVDSINRIEIVDTNLISHAQPTDSLDDNMVQKLMALLDHYRVMER